MLTPDTLLNERYRVVRLIGQGGMGAVYEAVDQRLRARVALKQTTVGGEQLSRAFEREAQLLAGLRHPALPRVIDHFITPEGQFLVMEFIPGDDLAAMLRARAGGFPLTQALAWADQLLDALEYLHSQSPPVVHRDIKPQNLKLTPRDEIILLDFGLAKGSAALATKAEGADASVFGYTPQYAPIEQVQGTGTNPRSDLYSLAATIYHLLTGQSPADALTRAAAVLNGSPDPLRPADALNSGVPRAVAGVLAQALTLRADERFVSAAAMRRAMREAAADAPAASIGPTLVARRPQTIAPPAPARVAESYAVEPTPDAARAELSAPKPARRRGRGWLILLIVVMLVLLGVALGDVLFSGV
ncbi:MAG: serine/threonine-protein kinase, partial [Chloroflexales bacterium]